MLLVYGFLLAILVSFISYRAHALSKGGAISALFLGTIVFGIGGVQSAVVLLTFFITSSLLSRAFKNLKQSLTEKYSKGEQRDAGQVFGNGVLATGFLLFSALNPESGAGWIGFVASLAAVNADTWATELGVLDPTGPRLITNLRKRVEKGTSGGISLVGTLAAFMGSSLIAALAALFGSDWTLFPIIALAGFAGSLFDSYLGATVQAMYFCPKDQKETEKHPLHTCGTETVHLRGWKWLTNDWVNFACSAIGVVTALALK